MRSKLKAIGDGQRHTFTGTFVRPGYKNSYKTYKPTLLIKNLTCDGEIQADHLWLNYGLQFLRLGELVSGDVLQFDGRITDYWKGYYNHQTHDYKVERPTKVKIIKAVTTNYGRLPMPEENPQVIGMIMLTNKQFYLDHGRPYEQWYVDQYQQWKQQVESAEAEGQL